MVLINGNSVNKVKSRSLRKSFEYLKKAENLIPALSQTFSKAPQYLVKGVYPVYLQRGDGSHVRDVDGNEYIDYILGLGPVTLGYNYPRVNQAIIEQLKEGISFSLPHPLEIELSELLTGIIPSAEMVRFSKTGSEVTSAAVRAARAFTGREKLAYCGYHGWHEWYSVTTSRNKGIPAVMKDLILPFEANNIESLAALFRHNPDKIAAVIMEPIVLEAPPAGFLSAVRKMAHENGALLIFDEIVSGFRASLGGAQEYCKVVPDLSTCGKGMANGMPLSAVVGRRDVMKMYEEVFFSTTFGGETLSIAASLATIREMQEKKTIEYVWKMGEKLTNGFNKLVKMLDLDAETVGLPCHFKFVIRDKRGEESREVKSLFMQEMVKRGVLLHSGAVNLSFSHDDKDINQTLEACEESLRIVKKALAEDKVKESLEGEPYQEVFRRFF